MSDEPTSEPSLSNIEDLGASIITASVEQSLSSFSSNKTNLGGGGTVHTPLSLSNLKSTGATGHV